MDITSIGFPMPSAAAEAGKEESAPAQPSCCSRIAGFVVDVFKMIVYVLSCTMIDLWDRTATDETGKSKSKAKCKPESAPELVPEEQQESKPKCNINELRELSNAWAGLYLEVQAHQVVVVSLEWHSRVINAAEPAKEAYQRIISTKVWEVVSFPPPFISSIKLLHFPNFEECNEEELLEKIQEYKKLVARDYAEEVTAESLVDVKQARVEIKAKTSVLEARRSSLKTEANRVRAEVLNLAIRAREATKSKQDSIMQEGAMALAELKAEHELRLKRLK